MPHTPSALVLLATAALAACPSKPPRASLIEDDGSGDAAGGGPGSMPPDARNVIELGFPNLLPGTRMMDSKDLIGFPIHVAASQVGELVGWGVRSVPGPPGTQVRMALYSNAGIMNQPTMLLTQSGNWDLAAGVLPTSGFYLNAGDYWLLLSVSDMVSIGRSTVSPADSTQCYRALVFTVAFPNPWDSGSCFPADPINIFIRLRPST